MLKTLRTCSMASLALLASSVALAEDAPGTAGQPAGEEAPAASTDTTSTEATSTEATSTEAAPATTAAPAPAAAPAPVAPAPAPADKAREALATQEGDVTTEAQLKEVFQSAEKQYSLLKSGEFALNYSFDYGYYRNDRVDIAFSDSGNISRFMIEQDAQHSFSNSFSVDYGIWNNLTINTRLPLVIKYDSAKDVKGAALGDVSFGLRWQPFPIQRGAPSTTLFATFSTATGDSPYKINPNTDLSSGKGYYASSFGASTSKVIDPAVVYGSLSYTMGFDVTDLDQARGNRVLTEVHPGDSIGFSFGMAYSLSYDLSVSVSYSQSYAFQTEYLFSNGDFVGSEDSTSASLNASVGIRMSPQRIVNVGFGFGLTEEASDVSLGISLPIDIAGLKK
ncbi:MAG: transporter [Gammaproteobacteria bacterium]